MHGFCMQHQVTQCARLSALGYRQYLVFWKPSGMTMGAVQGSRPSACALLHE
jgi:hypothetical protein